MLKATELRESVFKLSQYPEDTLRFDACIQRNQVWNDEQKSLFIHSLIYGFPIPAFYAQDTGEKDDIILWMLDGKQRMSTALNFIKGDSFKLHKTTPKIGDVELKGKKFSDLPKEFQDNILNTTFVIHAYKGLSPDERDELFHRLNKGTSLSKIEINRVLAGTSNMEFIQSLCNEKFFAESVKLSDNGRNRFVDEELILQILALVMNNCKAVSFAGNDMRTFCENLKVVGIKDEVKEIMLATTKYLNDALPAQEVWLKKVNVPMVFALALRANDEEIPAVKFGGWAKSFLKRVDNDYYEASRSGTAKKEKVDTRLKLMTAHYEKNIANAKNYEAPKARQTVVQLPVKTEEKAGEQAPEQAPEANKNQASEPKVDVIKDTNKPADKKAVAK